MVVEEIICTIEDGVEEYNNIQVYRGPFCHENGITGYGKIDAGIVYVGISPAKDEITRSRRPLTGPSGKLLNAVLKAIGQERSNAYCTNLVCNWKDDPSREEAQKCATRLDTELRLIKPKVIVLLGKIVAEIFTNRQFGKVRGAVEWNETYKCYVIATYHPAAILRSMGQYGASKDDKAAGMIPDFVKDLRRISDILTWLPGAPEAKISYTVVDNSEEAQQVLDNLPKMVNNDSLQSIPVALDVETTYSKDDEEVEIFENELLCVGVGTISHCWVFTPRALYHEGTQEQRSALVWPDDVCWTMQNAIFDTQVMKLRLATDITVREDTMLQSYTLDERGGIHALKPMARAELACGFYEEDRYGKSGRMKPQDLPKEALYEYNAKDVCYTARICLKYRVRQIEDEVRGFYDRLLIPGINMYKEVQYRGVQVDKELHQKYTIMWGTRWLDDEEELKDIAEQEGFPGRVNLNSPKQLSTLLFKILSLPITKYTRAGAPSTDKDVIEALRGQHPFVDKMASFRHLDHMFNQYIIGLGARLKIDGRAHAVVALHRTATGRPAYKKPNLQNIPVSYDREGYDEMFAKLRHLFIPSSTEFVNNFRVKYLNLPPLPTTTKMVIVEADYGKAEIWMAYDSSGDEQMYADLTSGDYHTTVAMDVMNKQREEVTGSDRLDMKRVTFGIMYDREAPSLSKAIKSSVARAQAYINGFFARNKKYAKWFRETQETIRKYGELVTKTGRKRRIIILGNANRALKQAVNFPIQSTASDILLDSAIELHNNQEFRELGGSILFTVHDSIVSECPESALPRCTEIIHDIMTARRFSNITQIPVEIKAGDNWGECHSLHECGQTKKDGSPVLTDKFGRTQECLWPFKKVE